ncbi:hypothetical protein BABINDRAFT_39276 [Babjeviella inositovora NRRL Y-12698]|uniref:Golgi apparatus membrane protein TVP18 n=1 Tax=Babjeviella inositovora NRRL Y-12698 TaxID=984486 RepID=A0A1E3QLL4_9ASCO|nr:uncharacterized protein BABINDRAFT_39276 [Babjeviella inositovora NRRL Y-12698]ODQ78575.1 hypothetical protein BABINDRAFT_39276 [Babjeviella inositovora NRRL Y-12698]
MAFKDFLNFSGFSDDFKARNYSVYGQWTGIISIFVCIGLGIANLFHVSVVIVFGIICIVQGLILVFVEIPFMLKCCPMSDNFVNAITKFEQNWWRVGFYVVMALVQWLSLTVMVTSLICPAIILTFGAVFYAIAALKHQEFVKSSMVNNGGKVVDNQEFIRQVL